jgi:hypothetical protein
MTSNVFFTQYWKRNLFYNTRRPGFAMKLRLSFNTLANYTNDTYAPTHLSLDSFTVLTVSTAKETDLMASTVT